METKKENPTAQAPEEAVATKKVNKKALAGAGVVVLAVVVIALVCYLINMSAQHKADEAIALADVEQNDSIQLSLYKDAAQMGHKSGNRAKLEVAIALYKKGEYEEAIKYLDDASIKSEVFDAGRLTLMGDCYVNLGNYDEALKCYNKAISASDNNPEIVPFVLAKEANIYRAQGNYTSEAKAYQTIYNDYPEYAQDRRFDIRKYIERANADAAKQK